MVRSMGFDYTPRLETGLCHHIVTGLFGSLGRVRVYLHTVERMKLNFLWVADTVVIESRHTSVGSMVEYDSQIGHGVTK